MQINTSFAIILTISEEMALLIIGTGTANKLKSGPCVVIFQSPTKGNIPVPIKFINTSTGTVTKYAIKQHN